LIRAEELLGEILPPKLRGTPRTVRHLVDVDRLQWPAPVEVPKVVLMPKLPPVPQGKRKAAVKPVRLSHADWLAVQRANAANLHAQLRARREAQAPAREARKARIAEVGAFIKRRRKVMDLSQSDVARLMGYPTRAQVGAFETGSESLPLKRVASMAAALQCEPERLRVPPLSEYLEAME
jgi:DNA-binding transcriptional regulator YiaG